IPYRFSLSGRRTARWQGTNRVDCSFFRPRQGITGMADETGEHERTLAFAEIALTQIKALRQAATPRNYEVWYTYATGYYPSLNQAINETLQRTGTLTQKDIDEVYSTYLSPVRISDRLDNVGERVVDEIDVVMAILDEAMGAAATHSENIEDARVQLG